MKDYTKVCWNCGSKKVSPVESYYLCQDCRATHVPQPETLIHYDLFERRLDPGRSKDAGRGIYSGSPSDGLASAMAKARKAT